MAKREYTRLTSPRRRVLGGMLAIGSGYSSLWVGSDHLLCIDSTGYAEEYKRFYYRDIQAIKMRRTSRRLVSAMILALPLMGFLWGISANLNAADGVEAEFWVCLIFAVPLGIAFLYNLIAGPTVRCYLQTAVQTEELPPLNRWRRANKVINKLRPLIAQAQGEMSREEIAQKLHQAGLEAIAATAGVPVAPPEPIAPPPIEPPPPANP